MSETAGRPETRRGARVTGARGARIGVVDAVFVDYLLVRTGGLPPVDLYIPTTEVTADDPQHVTVDADRAQAYQRWHRPLKSVSHD